MSNIVDAFVATLGLDDRDFKRGQKEYDQSTKRMRETSDRASKDMEASQRRVAAGYRTVRNEVGGLLLAFAGASSLKSFVTDMLAGDAATGRLARNLDMGVNRLHAWQEALKTVGGTAADANQSLSTVVDDISRAIYMGDVNKGFALARMGMDYRDLKDPNAALLKMAENRGHLDRRGFNLVGGMLGINQNTLNLLQQGRPEVEKMLRLYEKQAPLTEKAAKEAEAYQKALAGLTTEIQGQARPWVTSLAESITSVIKSSNEAGWTIPLLTGATVALGIAAIGATAPWLALAAAIALATKKMSESPQVRSQKWEETRQFYKSLQRGDWSGAWENFKGGARETLSGRDPTGPTWGGGKPSAGGGGRAGGSNSRLVDYLVSQGFSGEQAAGIRAGIYAESGGNPNAVNPTSGAYGIGQWLGGRKKELFRRYGSNPTAEQQLQFLVWELKGGDPGGASVRKQTTADHALLAYITKFMRPAAGDETTGDIRRGRAILGGRPARGAAAGNRSTSQTTTVGQITIVVPNGDPDTIAKGVRGALAKHEIVNQANTGMTP